MKQGHRKPNTAQIGHSDTAIQRYDAAAIRHQVHRQTQHRANRQTQYRAIASAPAAKASATPRNRISATAKPNTAQIGHSDTALLSISISGSGNGNGIDYTASIQHQHQRQRQRHRQLGGNSEPGAPANPILRMSTSETATNPKRRQIGINATAKSETAQFAISDKRHRQHGGNSASAGAVNPI